MRRFLAEGAVGILVALCSASAGAPAAQAPEGGERIARIVMTVGTVQTVRADGAPSELGVKDPVFKNGTLRTGEGSRAQVLFADGAILELAENSEVKVEEYSYDAATLTAAMKLYIGQGAFRILSGPMVKKSSATLEVAKLKMAAGVRGRFYAGRVTERGLHIVLLGGEKLVVTTSAGTAEIAQPLFGAWVRSADTAPGRPAKLAAEEINDLASAFSTGSKERAPVTLRGDATSATLECRQWGYWDGDFPGNGASTWLRTSPGDANRSSFAVAYDLISPGRTLRGALASGSTSRFSGSCSGGS